MCAKYKYYEQLTKLLLIKFETGIIHFLRGIVICVPRNMTKARIEKVPMTI